MRNNNDINNDMNNNIKNISRGATASRADGAETRAKILDAAGRIFARYGYDAATSKQICAAARVNAAAVNYYFGSRDALYAAVLKEAHTRLMSLDVLARLENSGLPPQEKISLLLDLYISAILCSDAWHMEIWLRELLQPTQFFQKIFQAEVLPKLRAVLRLFAAHLALPPDDKRLCLCLYSVVSPFALLFQGGRNPVQAQLLRDFLGARTEKEFPADAAERKKISADAERAEYFPEDAAGAEYFPKGAEGAQARAAFAGFLRELKALALANLENFKKNLEQS